MHIVGILAVATIIGSIGAGVYVAEEQGYIPTEKNLQIIEPLGYKEISSTSLEHRFQSILDEIPNYHKLKKKIYISDYNTQEISLDYKQKLEADDYTEYTNGKRRYQDIEINYYGFLKGISAVGLVIVPGDDVGYPTESVILYTTGNALDYKEILDWYNGLSGKEKEILLSKVENQI